MNTELMKQVRDQIFLFPETHNQETFISECGTTQCMAGHAMLLSGEYMQHPSSRNSVARIVNAEGDDVDCGVSAKNLLQLPVKMAVDMFYYSSFSSDEIVEKMDNSIKEYENTGFYQWDKIYYEFDENNGGSDERTTSN